MTIEKLKNGKYRATRMVDGKRYRVTFDHKPTKREATEALERLTANAASFADNNISFAQAFESYLEAKSDVLSPSTLKSYRGDYAQLSVSFASTRINELNQLAIQREINSISARVAPKTVRNVHAIISAVLGMFRPGLALHTTLPQPRPRDMYLPEKEDIAAIMEDVKGTEYYAPFALAICGMRRSEIMAVRSADLDGNCLRIHSAQVNGLEGLVMKDTTKNPTSTRHIYIPEDVADIIREKDCAYGGHPNNLPRELHRIQGRHGLTRFRFHDLRAYFASYAHVLGIPDQLIQEAGGWKTDHTMKKIYRRTMQDEYKESQKEYLDKIKKLISDS